MAYRDTLEERMQDRLGEVDGRRDQLRSSPRPAEADLVHTDPKKKAYYTGYNRSYPPTGVTAPPSNSSTTADSDIAHEIIIQGERGESNGRFDKYRNAPRPAEADLVHTDPKTKAYYEGYNRTYPPPLPPAVPPYVGAIKGKIFSLFNDLQKGYISYGNNENIVFFFCYAGSVKGVQYYPKMEDWVWFRIVEGQKGREARDFVKI